MTLQKLLRIFYVLLALQLLQAIGTLAVGFYFDQQNLAMLETGIYVGITLVIVGMLIFKGAGTGDSMRISNMTSSVSDSPYRLRLAQYQELVSGQNFGVLLTVAGLLWFGLMYGTTQFLA